NERTPIALTFHELDDFHPDRLLARADVFRALLEACRRLEDPATFEEAAAALGVRPGAPAAPTPSPAETPPPGAAAANLAVGSARPDPPGILRCGAAGARPAVGRVGGVPGEDRGAAHPPRRPAAGRADRRRGRGAGAAPPRRPPPPRLPGAGG